MDVWSEAETHRLCGGRVAPRAFCYRNCGIRAKTRRERTPPSALPNRECEVRSFRSSRHRIVGHAVVPQDLALVILGQWQSEEMIDGFGIARIYVRIVRRKDQIVVADLLDDIVGDHFVGLDGHTALTFEIITGLLL